MANANVCPVNNNGNYCNTQYRSALTTTDLVGASTVCTAGQFTRLGEYKVLAGDLIALGYGDCDCQNTAIGRIYMAINVAGPTLSPGTVRITAMTSADRPHCILFESRTEIASLNATLRSEWLTLPQNDMWLSQDKRYELSFNPDTTATITNASVVYVDTTKEDV